MSIKMEGKFEAALSRIDAMIVKLRQPYSQPLNIPLYPIGHPQIPIKEVTNPNLVSINLEVCGGGGTMYRAPIKMKFPNFKEVKLPNFKGGDPTNWIRGAEHFFEFYGIPDAEKLKYAWLGLSGGATLWYHKHIRPRIHDILWPVFLEELIVRFAPTEIKDCRGVLSELSQNEVSTVLEKNDLHEDAVAVSNVESVGVVESVVKVEKLEEVQHKKSTQSGSTKFLINEEPTKGVKRARTTLVDQLPSVRGNVSKVQLLYLQRLLYVRRNVKKTKLEVLIPNHDKVVLNGWPPPMRENFVQSFFLQFLKSDTLVFKSNKCELVDDDNDDLFNSWFGNNEPARNDDISATKNTENQEHSLMDFNEKPLAEKNLVDQQESGCEANIEICKEPNLGVTAEFSKEDDSFMRTVVSMDICEPSNTRAERGKDVDSSNISGLQRDTSIGSESLDRDLNSDTNIGSGNFGVGLDRDASVGSQSLGEGLNRDTGTGSEREIHAYSYRNNLELDRRVKNALVSVYSTHGSMENAERVFGSIRNRDVISWSSMVVGYSQNQCLIEAIKTYMEMVRAEIEPNLITITSVLSACAGVSGLSSGKELHSWAIKNSVDVNSHVDSALLYMYAKCGRINSLGQSEDIVLVLLVAFWPLLEIIRLDFKTGLENLLKEKTTKAIFLGTRIGDPNAIGQEQFSPSSPGWPPFMRVNPILDWSYRDVWAFLLTCKVQYCSLYDKGYTSIGSIHDTVPNAQLCVLDKSSTEEHFKPAYLLSDGRSERAGRAKKLTSSSGSSPPALSNGLSNVYSQQSCSLSASIIAVGDEILFGTTEDKIGAILCKKLCSIGWLVAHTAFVRNDIDSVAEEVERRKSKDDMVFLFGGFGPLHSDISLAGVAKALGVRLAPDEEFEEYLRHLIGEQCTGDRNEMVLLPEGITKLLHHEKLPVPLIKCQNVIVLSATNVFELEVEWNCLVELAVTPLVTVARFVSLHLSTMLSDMETAESLSKLCSEFPDIHIGCHRKSRVGPLIISFIGKDQTRVESTVQEFPECELGDKLIFKGVELSGNSVQS